MTRVLIIIVVLIGGWYIYGSATGWKNVPSFGLVASPGRVWTPGNTGVQGGFKKAVGGVSGSVTGVAERIGK